ncbi:MAG: hypothetical protein GY722_23525 [bacterium]|nr:hypothetical protein [bacterium]
MSATPRLPNRFALLALVMMTGVVAGRAGASPLPFGTTYTVEVNNFGGCAVGGGACETGQSLTWDGIAEAVPGTALTVNEMGTSDPYLLPSVAGGTYQAVAANFGTYLNFGPNYEYKLLEIWIEDATPGGFTGPGGIGDSAAFSGVNFTDIFYPPGVWEPGHPPAYGIGRSVAGTLFLYFTIDGVVFNIQDALALGWPISGHPFNPAITYGVWHTGFPQVGSIFPDISVDSSMFNVPWSVLEFALGMQGQGVNGVHVGMLVYDFPEPKSALLVGISLIAIAAFRRRRA